jgi:hypothetical protein
MLLCVEKLGYRNLNIQCRGADLLLHRNAIARAECPKSESLWQFGRAQKRAHQIFAGLMTVLHFR